MQMSIIVALLSILTAIAVCAVVSVTGDVVVPLVVAWFLTQTARPILRAGEKMRLPHILNVLLVFGVIFAIIMGGVKFMTSQVTDSERLVAAYGPKLNALSEWALDAFQLPAESFSVLTLARRYLGSISSGVLGISSQVVMTLVFLLFMLLEVPGWDAKVDRAFPTPQAERIRMIMNAVSEQTSRYLGAMIMVSFITGICVYATLMIIGVEFAAGWAMMAFFLNFIPNIGPLIATIPPVLMAALQYGHTSPQALVTLGIIGLIQIVTGNIIAPKMFGDSLGLSPVVVMLSLLLWSLILGIPGAILSVPIASIIKIVCENIPVLRPIAVIMGTGHEGGRPK